MNRHRRTEHLKTSTPTHASHRPTNHHHHQITRTPQYPSPTPPAQPHTHSPSHASSPPGRSWRYRVGLRSTRRPSSVGGRRRAATGLASALLHPRWCAAVSLLQAPSRRRSQRRMAASARGCRCPLQRCLCCRRGRRRRTSSSAVPSSSLYSAVSFTALPSSGGACSLSAT